MYYNLICFFIYFHYFCSVFYTGDGTKNINCTPFHEQIKSFKTAASEEEKTRQDDKKQVEVYQSHSKFMKAKVLSPKVSPWHASCVFVLWYKCVRHVEEKLGTVIIIITVLNLTSNCLCLQSWLLL